MGSGGVQQAKRENDSLARWIQAKKCKGPNKRAHTEFHMPRQVVATMGGGNARSLYNMENSDMHMVSSLQLPYQQWSREEPSGSFAYAKQHGQQEHHHAVQQPGQELSLDRAANLGGHEQWEQQDKKQDKRKGQQAYRCGKAKWSAGYR